MTDDAENLRKFLESDDPAMRRMGLSMAKGSGVPEELLPTILGLYMWDDDKSVRAAAKSVFTKYAPAEIQAKVKENWKASYRTLSVTGDKFPEAVRPFLEAFKSQDDFAEVALVPLTKALGDAAMSVRRHAAKALGEIGDVRAVEPLIKALGEGNSSAAGALGKIGDVRAVEPLIKAFGEGNSSAAGALGKIGDGRAVEQLIKLLKDESSDVRRNTVKALGKIRDPRAIGPIIEVLEDFSQDEFTRVAAVRWSAAVALGEIGDERAAEPLIKALGDEDKSVREAAKEALEKLGHEVE